MKKLTHPKPFKVSVRLNLVNEYDDWFKTEKKEEENVWWTGGLEYG